MQMCCKLAAKLFPQDPAVRIVVKADDNLSFAQHAVGVQFPFRAKDFLDPNVVVAQSPLKLKSPWLVRCPLALSRPDPVFVWQGQSLLQSVFQFLHPLGELLEAVIPFHCIFFPDWIDSLHRL